MIGRPKRWTEMKSKLTYGAKMLLSSTNTGTCKSRASALTNLSLYSSVPSNQVIFLVIEDKNKRSICWKGQRLSRAYQKLTWSALKQNSPTSRTQTASIVPCKLLMSQMGGRTFHEKVFSVFTARITASSSTSNYHVQLKRHWIRDSTYWT